MWAELKTCVWARQPTTCSVKRNGSENTTNYCVELQSLTHVIQFAPNCKGLVCFKVRIGEQKVMSFNKLYADSWFLYQLIHFLQSLLQLHLYSFSPGSWCLKRKCLLVMYQHYCDPSKGNMSLAWEENTNMEAEVNCEDSCLFVTQAAQLRS